jgi:DNA-directed RNA polymerase specialized sigma24 family protein
MEHQESGSVSRWLCDLKGGDREAVQPLWERYFAQMVSLARARLRALRTNRASSDEEDAALSAFESFCVGADQGRFPLLSDRDDLWRLLVVITARKVLARSRHDLRQKRGGGTVVSETDLSARGSAEESGPLDQVIGREPSPEFAAQMAEGYGRLLESLGDESLRTVAVWRMEGYTNDEIAHRLGCARRTIARRLELIRATWIAEGS